MQRVLDKCSLLLYTYIKGDDNMNHSKFYQTNLDGNMKIKALHEFSEGQVVTISSDLFEEFKDSTFTVKKIDGKNIVLKPKRNAEHSDITGFAWHIRKVNESHDSIFYVHTWKDYLKAKMNGFINCKINRVNKKDFPC